MDIIEIKDIPIAVLNAIFNFIWRLKITVSRIIDVISPLMIAKVIIEITGQVIPENWKKAMVPKSPMEQPKRHQKVLYDDLLHVCLHCQLTDMLFAISDIVTSINY